jgi:low affinity Fe/Cu permease
MNSARGAEIASPSPGSTVCFMEQPPSVQAMLEQLTSEVRRMLRATENEPVGVLSAYRNSILRLADAIDRLASEIDSRTKPQ